MVDQQSTAPPISDGVAAWFPQYREFGYSRAEAVQIVRIAERLWSRYTARGLTSDSEMASATALDAFEVLVQAIYHFGVAELADERAQPGDMVGIRRKRKKPRRTADVPRIGDRR